MLAHLLVSVSVCMFDTVFDMFNFCLVSKICLHSVEIMCSRLLYASMGLKVSWINKNSFVANGAAPGGESHKQPWSESDILACLTAWQLNTSRATLGALILELPQPWRCAQAFFPKPLANRPLADRLRRHFNIIMGGGSQFLQNHQLLLVTCSKHARISAVNLYLAVFLVRLYEK